MSASDRTRGRPRRFHGLLSARGVVALALLAAFVAPGVAGVVMAIL